MGALEFLDKHIYVGTALFVFCSLLGATIAMDITASAVQLWQRMVRHMNIRAKGWPPKHVNADGDPIIFRDAFSLTLPTHDPRQHN